MTIVVLNNSGLGNRIKNIVSAVRKGHLVGDVVDIRCDHGNLISVAQCVDVPRNDVVEIMSTWSLELLEVDSGRKLLRAPKFLVEFHDRHTFGSLGERIDFQYFNIEQSIIDEFLRYFALVIFNREVVDVVESVASEMRLGEKVGVHIRTWYDAPDRFASLYNIQDFFSVLDGLADTEQFLLCVDHEIARAAVLSRYGSNRVFERQGREIGHISFDRRSRVGFDSLVDLLLLSRCRQLVGTYQSTFSECAWWLGGASKLIHIPIPKFILDLEREIFSG